MPVYIFRHLSPQEGYKRLQRSADQMQNIEQIKESGTILWLLRESRVPGMLTIDYIHWKNGKWACDSTRLALTAHGWVSSNNLENPETKAKLATMIHATQEAAEAHEASLLPYIQNLDLPDINKKLNLENRVNPSIDEQTKTTIYSHYATTAPRHNHQEHQEDSSTENQRENKKRKQSEKREKIEVILTPGVLQAITCPITGQTFRDPVVMRRNYPLNSSTAKSYQLEKGKTYERSALAGMPSELYYDNVNLKMAIDRLGSFDPQKIEAMEEERLDDKVLLETLTEPCILPSGHSFSRATIQSMVDSGRSLACPYTRKAFQINDVVDNVNLQIFLQEWPICRDNILRRLKEEVTGNNNNNNNNLDDDDDYPKIKKLKKK